MNFIIYDKNIVENVSDIIKKTKEDEVKITIVAEDPIKMLEEYPIVKRRIEIEMNEYKIESIYYLGNMVIIARKIIR